MIINVDCLQKGFHCLNVQHLYNSVWRMYWSVQPLPRCETKPCLKGLNGALNVLIYTCKWVLWDHRMSHFSFEGSQSSTSILYAICVPLMWQFDNYISPLWCLVWIFTPTGFRCVCEVLIFCLPCYPVRHPLALGEWELVFQCSSKLHDARVSLWKGTRLRRSCRAALLLQGRVGVLSLPQPGGLHKPRHS